MAHRINPATRYRRGMAVWLTRVAEDGLRMHYPCHVSEFNKLTGLYYVTRADDRARPGVFVSPNDLSIRQIGELAPGVMARTRTEELVAEARR